MADDVIATTRIYEEVPIPRTDRTRRVLRYGIGAVIPAADQKRLQVSKDGGQTSVPMAETDESGMVVPLPSSGQPAPTPQAQRDPVTPPRKAAPARKAAKARKTAKRR